MLKEKLEWTTGEILFMNVLMFLLGALIIGFMFKDSYKTGCAEGYSRGIHETEEVRQLILAKDSINTLLNK